MKSFLMASVLICSLSGCASIVEGSSQNIAVNTNPPGATCGLYRDNLRIATIESTPGSAKIDKSRRDIWVECVKAGFDASAQRDKSDVSAATFGNLVAGGIVGVLVDNATGANNKYDSSVDVTLTPSQIPSATASLPDTFDGKLAEQAAPAIASSNVPSSSVASSQTPVAAQATQTTVKTAQPHGAR